MSSLTFAIANMPARTSIVSSPGEDVSALSAHARAHFPKSDIQIRIKHHYKTKTYTSSSPVEGEVIITTQRDVRFDSIEIVLLGSSKTRTEGYSAPHESTHTFLKLIMPIPESSYPVPRVLEPGRSITIPFNFILPNFLTLNACNHKIESDQFHEQHLCLPPSMGSWARGNWEKDDLAPFMAEVEYSVKARVWRQATLRERPIKVMEGVKAIQVLPTFAEDAPLSISKADNMYRMSRTKTLRKNIISSKLGSLVVSAQQPRAIMLHPDGSVAAGSTAQLDLSFEPLCPDAQPPKVTGVSMKLVAHTFYSSGPIRSAPNIGDWMKEGIMERRGVYSTGVVLPAHAPEGLAWRADHGNRRDSGYGSESFPENPSSSEDDCDEPSQHRQHRRSIASLMRLSKGCSHSTPPTSPRRAPSPCRARHTASLHLPLVLPTAKRAFVPSFHTCIVSRVYTLHVSLTAAGLSSAVSLDVPLQIAVEADAGAAEAAAAAGRLPSWEDAVEEAAADAFLSPRTLGVPDSEFRETSVLPGYARRS